MLAVVAAADTFVLGDNGYLYPRSHACPLCRVRITDEDADAGDVMELARNYETPKKVAFVHVHCEREHGLTAAIQAAFRDLTNVTETPPLPPGSDAIS